MHQRHRLRLLAPALLSMLAATIVAAPPASALPYYTNTQAFAGSGVGGTPLVDDGPAFGSDLWQPTDVAVNGSGVIIADKEHNEVRVVDANGIIHAYFGNGVGTCDATGVLAPYGLAVGPNGSVYVSTGCGTVIQVAADRTAQIVASNLVEPTGLDYDASSGCLYIADTGASRILKECGGQLSVVAGTGTAGYNGDGVATDTQLSSPLDVVVHNGLVYVADTQNSLVRTIDAQGQLATLAGTPLPSSLAFSTEGTLFVVSQTPGQLTYLDSTSTLAYVIPLHDYLGGIAFDSQGVLYVADIGTEYVYSVLGLSNGTGAPNPDPSPTPTPTPPPPPAPKLNWVALGDSFSSGEGVEPFIEGTDVKGDQCHRSTLAYAVDIVKAQSDTYSLEFHACSGAVFNDFYNANHSNRLEKTPQIKWLTANTDIVTLTIGGNDAYFADVMTYCATRTSLMQTCQQKWSSKVDKALSQLRAKYDNLIFNIKIAAPRAKVYLLGYPRFFPVSPPLNCPTGVPGYVFGQSDMAWINSEIQGVDRIAQASAQDAGITYVDTYDMVGVEHDLCSNDPWINRAVPSSRSYSYHPTAMGQVELSGLLLAKLN